MGFWLRPSRETSRESKKLPAVHRPYLPQNTSKPSGPPPSAVAPSPGETVQWRSVDTNLVQGIQRAFQSSTQSALSTTGYSPTPNKQKQSHTKDSSASWQPSHIDLTLTAMCEHPMYLCSWNPYPVHTLNLEIQCHDSISIPSVGQNFAQT